METKGRKVEEPVSPRGRHRHPPSQLLKFYILGNYVRRTHLQRSWSLRQRPSSTGLRDRPGIGYHMPVCTHWKVTMCIFVFIFLEVSPMNFQDATFLSYLKGVIICAFFSHCKLCFPCRDYNICRNKIYDKIVLQAGGMAKKSYIVEVS